MIATQLKHLEHSYEFPTSLPCLIYCQNMS